MNCHKQITEDITEKTFTLLISALTWKNRNFNLSNNCMNREQKTFRKYFFILFYISQIENCTLSDLERLLIENRSTISQAVSKMHKKGFVTKHMPKQGDDGRKVYFRITNEGNARIDECMKLIKEDIDDFIVKLTDENKRYFLVGIENFNKALENMNIMFEHKEVY